MTSCHQRQFSLCWLQSQTSGYPGCLSKFASFFVKSLSRVRLFATPWTVAYWAPLSMAFSRQEYWSGLPFSSPGDLPDPGIEPGSPVLQADTLPSEPEKKIYKHLFYPYEDGQDTKLCVFRLNNYEVIVPLPRFLTPLDIMLSFTKRHIFIVCSPEQWVCLRFSNLCFLAAWGDGPAHGGPCRAGGSGPMPPEERCPRRCQSQGRCWCLGLAAVTRMPSISKGCCCPSSDVEMPRTIGERINSVTVFQAEMKRYSEYTHWKIHSNFRNINV